MAIRGNTQILNATIEFEQLSLSNAYTTDLASSASATELARADAIKSYVDGLVDGSLKTPEGYDPTTTNNYPTTYNGGTIQAGDSFRITVDQAGIGGGNRDVNVEDLLIALVDNASATTDTDWMVAESNRTQATESALGVAEIATQVEADAGTDDLRYITPLKLATYLTNAGISPGQAQNGLTQNGNFVELGGTLNRNTSIAASTFDYEVSKTVTGGLLGTIASKVGSRYAQFTASAIGTPGGMVGVDGETGEAFIKAYNETSGAIAWIHGTATELLVGAETSPGVNMGSWEGIKYEANYSANYVNRSLVDKEYVDNAAAAGTLANNGLTKTGNTIEIGGTLTKTTTIEGSGNSLRLENTVAGVVSKVEVSTNVTKLTVDDTGAGGQSWVNVLNTGIDITSHLGDIGIESTSDVNIKSVNVALEANSNLNFTDSEVSSASISTPIPFAIQPTTDYGNGNTLLAGGSINQFRSEFTDDGIINALLEVKAMIDATGTQARNGLTVNNGFAELGGNLTHNTEITISNVTLSFVGDSGSADNVEIGNASDPLDHITLYSQDNTNITSLQQVNMTAMTDVNIRSINDSVNIRCGTGAGDEVTLTTEPNAALLTSQPDGTAALAIATTKYVDDSISANNVRKYNETTTVDVANQWATLTSAPTTGISNPAVYNNGVRQQLTVDYTVNAGAGRFEFTASSVLTAGDVVVIDYEDR